jgi:nitrous oxidase accessory protein
MRRARVTIVTVGVVLALTTARAGEAPARVEQHGRWLQQQLAAAPAGAIIDVPPGEHQGPFVVDRPLHLRGGGRAVLRGDGTTHVVAIRAADVVIEGFHVRDSGTELIKDHAAIHISGARAVIRDNTVTDSLHGIYVRKVDDVRIERNTIVGRQTTLELVDPETLRPTPGAGEMCEVSLNQNRRGNGIHIWYSRGHVIAGNVISQTRDGIYFSFVDRSDVHDNRVSQVRYGLHYMYSDGNRFANNRFTDNAAGAALMFSQNITLTGNHFSANRNHRAYGLLFQTVELTDVLGNDIAGNTVGLFMEGGHGNRVLDNRLAGNHLGVHVSGSADENTFAGNTFAGNLHTVEVAGYLRGTLWAREGRGNYWDGAMRLDLDRNGIVDLPHHELDLFGHLRRPFPAIGLMVGSPGERLLRFVHSRVRLPGLSGITDPSPLVEGQHR